MYWEGNVWDKMCLVGFIGLDCDGVDMGWLLFGFLFELGCC